ncbi:MAG: cupredoxin domain-containing protein [Chloroflexi bacterium]|nr:cupredoxin domain-containing protein [Chloroflexota bacterium]
MEYIQTILFQIPATQLEQASEAGGLLAELDGHRQYLQGVGGFRDFRITRSINNEGNVLVVVETRWADDSSLVRYETQEPNAATIVRAHEGILVRDSLQVLDMEALRTEASFKQAGAAESARERVILPIAIPLGVLAFALLAIYGLSRVYLEIQGNGAVALAAGLAIGVLLTAFYFAANPRAPGWQITGVIAIVAIALAGGTTWALIEEDGPSAEENGEQANGGLTDGAATGGTLIILGDNFFEHDGARNPDISVPLGQEVTFDLENQGVGIHNMHVNGTDDTYDINLCETGDDSTACSDPDVIRGSEQATITIQFDETGTYNFRCDFHPTEMMGKLVVE